MTISTNIASILEKAEWPPILQTAKAREDKAIVLVAVFHSACRSRQPGEKGNGDEELGSPRPTDASQNVKQEHSRCVGFEIQSTQTKMSVCPSPAGWIFVTVGYISAPFRWNRKSRTSGHLLRKDIPAIRSDRGYEQPLGLGERYCITPGLSYRFFLALAMNNLSVLPTVNIDMAGISQPHFSRPSRLNLS